MDLKNPGKAQGWRQQLSLKTYMWDEAKHRIGGLDERLKASDWVSHPLE